SSANQLLELVVRTDSPLSGEVIGAIDKPDNWASGDRCTGSDCVGSQAARRLRTSLPVCGRSAGFFRNSCETSSASQFGIPGTAANDAGSSWRIRATVAAFESV